MQFLLWLFRFVIFSSKMSTVTDTEMKEPRMTYGELIENCVGKLHRWQICVCSIVFLVNLPLVWQELAIIFLAPPPQFKCIDDDNNCATNCTQHEFDHSVFDNTIITEWDLVCERKWLASLAQTVLMLGILVGHITFGFYADKYGRRKPLVFAVIMQLIIGVCIAFTPWLWLFMVFRFLVAVAAGGTYCTAFVIVVEIVGRKYRSTLGILFQTTYYIGHALLGVFGYLIRDWHHLQLTISIPSVLLISYYWILPESPRWLLTVGRLEEAITVLEKGAKFNKMPTEHIRSLITTQLNNKEVNEENIYALLRTPNMRGKTLYIWLNWLILGLSYFGVAQYMGQIEGNIFLNVIISGLIQIPGNFVIIYLVKRWGRKITIIITYLICGCACLIITVLPTDPNWPTALLGAIGMMGISLSFTTVIIFSSELYPTVVRNVGLGTSGMFAKFGSMTAPFLDELTHSYAWLPPLIFGVGPLLGCFACLRLPETLDTKLPDTVEDAELFGKKENTACNKLTPTHINL